MLRCTSNLAVWRVVLLVLLVADFGHLLAVGGGSGGGESLRIYWDFTRWNAIDWGNVPFVYLGASMRIAFLSGVGLGGGGERGMKVTPRDKAT